MDLKIEKREIKKIIRKGAIRTFYQPLVSLINGEILGYEALSRGPEQSSWEMPLDLFSAAERHGLLWELDFLCRVKAIENFPESLENNKLFLNVSSKVVASDQHQFGATLKLLSQMELDAGNIILEVNEKTALEDFSLFSQVIEHYAYQGFNIAIDDSSSEFSGFSFLSRIFPQYIKIDRGLVCDIEKDFFKQDVVQSIKTFAGRKNIELIAEGIETAEELKFLINLGIDYGQGYFLQSPQEKNLGVSREKIKIIRDQNRKKVIFSQLSSYPIGNLADTPPSVEADITYEEISDLFLKDPAREILVIVDHQKKPRSLVYRDEFVGNRIFDGDKRAWEEEELLTYDYYSPFKDVFKKVVEDQIDLEDFIVVTRGDQYFGLIQVRKIRDCLKEMELDQSFEINSLTGLPDPKLIETKLKQFLEENTKFCIINFQMHNPDKYGLRTVQDLVGLKLRLLRDVLGGSLYPNYFLGQWKKNGFILMTSDQEIKERIENFYSSYLREAGEYFKNGNGTFLGIKIGGIWVESSKSELVEIKKEIEQVQKKLEEETGNVFNI